MEENNKVEIITPKWAGCSQPGNKYAAGHPGGRRPSQYHPDYVRIARSMARLGATNKEIAEALGISLSCLRAWRGTYKKFATAIKIGKEQANERVKEAMYEKACGYSYDDIEYKVVDKKLIGVPVVKHFPPDTRAGMFWLMNRDPENWKATPSGDTEKEAPALALTFSVAEAKQEIKITKGDDQK